jgi:hypothetical protein
MPEVEGSKLAVTPTFITYYSQAFVPLLHTVLKVCVATPEVGRCLGQQLQAFSTSLHSAAVERFSIDLRLITPEVGQPFQRLNRNP